MLALENVTFAHPGERPLLEGFSLAAGQVCFKALKRGDIDLYGEDTYAMVVRQDDGARRGRAQPLSISRPNSQDLGRDSSTLP